MRRFVFPFLLSLLVHVLIFSFPVPRQGQFSGRLSMFVHLVEGREIEKAKKESQQSIVKSYGKNLRRAELGLSMSMVIDSDESKNIIGKDSDYSLGMVLKKVAPIYPMASREAGEQGKTVLLLLLEEGRVKSMELEVSSGFPRLDNAAMAALGQWQFRSNLNGWIRVPVDFQLTR